MSLGIADNSINSNNSLEQIRLTWALTMTGMFGFIIVVAAVFFNAADFVGDKEGNVVDSQVWIKLAICGCAGLYGLYGIFKYGKVLDSLLTTPGLWVTLIGLFFLISVPFSVDPLSSLVATCIFWAILLAIPTVLHEIGFHQTMLAMFVGIVGFLLASYFAYFFIPDLGIFQEQLFDGGTRARMGGISHPNVLGMYSAFTILLAFYFIERQQFPKFVLLGVVGFAALTLVLALSRTSMAAVAIALLVAYYRQIIGSRNSVWVFLLIPLILISGMYLAVETDISASFDSILKRLTKSGDISELTTATGRLEIWGFAIRCIQESPLFGKGLATSKVVMQDYTMYAHNLWLNTAYSAGIFCGLFTVILTVSMLRHALSANEAIVTSIVIFVLVCGIFENTIFETIPSAATIAFLLVVFKSLASANAPSAPNGNLAGEAS